MEVLSPVPHHLELEPVEAQTFVREEMARAFPLGNFRDRTKSAIAARAHRAARMPQSCRASSAWTSSPVATRPGRRSRRAAPVPTADHRIKVAGFGGQGVLMLGEVLAEAGLDAGYHVSWLPSYGPEMRSGTSNCHVRISAAARRFAAGLAPHVLLALNEPSLRKFLPSVEPGGLVLYNADRLPADCRASGVRTIPIASTAIADGLGSPKVGNMVMLGALLEVTGMLPEGAIERALRRLVTRESWYELDLAALEAGRAAVRQPAATPDGPPPGRAASGG